MEFIEQTNAREIREIYMYIHFCVCVLETNIYIKKYTEHAFRTFFKTNTRNAQNTQNMYRVTHAVESSRSDHANFYSFAMVFG